MAEDVHVHQAPSNGGGGGAGWVVAVLVIIVLAAVLWFVFGRGGAGNDFPDEVNVEIEAPAGGGN